MPPRKESALNQNVARCQAPALTAAMKVGPRAKQAADPTALDKITALESELLKLRAQIAMIITAAPGAWFNQWLCIFYVLLGLVECQTAPGTPGMSPPPPAYTSTPRCVAAAAPPPPPPPPPVCSSSSNETCSVLELIRQRKNNKVSTLEREEVKGVPSMLDVLKDLGQVKLRSVERYTLTSTVVWVFKYCALFLFFLHCVFRSPGGNPVRRRRSKGVSASHSDPAALIAEALKRKFGQHHLNNSSDKENSLDLSPFSSPETPKVCFTDAGGWK